MKQKNFSIVEGTILETMPNTLFRVEITNGRKIIASVAGKMRRRFLRMLPGDTVKVEMTPYDQDRGRIVFRYK